MAKVALLIGVSQYEPGLNPLPAAEHDVDAMREVLLNPDIGGFSEPDLTVLLNPDRQTMEESIELLFSSRQKDDLILFYFSGHGIKDYSGKLFLASRKTRKSARGDLILSTAVSSAFIQDNMNRSRSRRQVIILDSCFSGAFAEGLSAKDDCSVDVASQLGGEGRAVLTSSSSTQYSFEEEGEKLSFYTRFLVDGIGTGAADQDEDGVVSIDELHDYASQKVREIRPEVKPEIYAVREGFKIHLTKVPPLSPTHRYRREVARFITRGELSLIGRRTLDVLRAQLRMDIAEAKAIEDEVLEPFRIEFREKILQYQQVFTETLEHQGSISDTDREQLQQLQQILGLRNEDTRPLEQEIITELKLYKQKLEEYEQLYTEALRQEFPLSEAKSTELSQLKQQYKLKEEDLVVLESHIYAEAEKYHKNLATFEKAFSQAVRKQYPLTEDKRTELKNLQHSLDLSDVDIAPVEAKVTNEIQTYQQKIQQYEQAFVNATQRKYYPGQATKKQLQETWQALGLEEADVQRIESRILKQVEQHQENLSRYVQELTQTISRHYPLGEEQRQQLQQKQAELNLTTEDIVQVEEQVLEEEEERREKLRQYEEAYREAIAFEFPISKTTLEELQRFQTILGLHRLAIEAIQQRVEAEVTGKNTPPPLTQYLNKPQENLDRTLVEQQTNLIRSNTATGDMPSANIQENEVRDSGLFQEANNATTEELLLPETVVEPQEEPLESIPEVRTDQVDQPVVETIVPEKVSDLNNSTNKQFRYSWLVLVGILLLSIPIVVYLSDYWPVFKQGQVEKISSDSVYFKTEKAILGGKTGDDKNTAPNPDTPSETENSLQPKTAAVGKTPSLVATPDTQTLPKDSTKEPVLPLQSNKTILPDGTYKYEGETKARRPHGKGVLYYDNGNIFNGSFKEGKLHAGTMNYKSGTEKEFKGDFKNGKPNGVGIMKFRDESTFIGKFVNGKPQGIGKMTVPNMSNHKQAEYVVIYSDNKPPQLLKIIYLDKSIYRGETDKDDNLFFKHGNGVITFANGDSMHGHWNDDLLIEDSIYTIYYHNGDLYYGTLTFTEDNGKYLKHGRGVMKHIDGKVDSGEWKMDKFIMKPEKESLDSSQEQLPGDSSKRWK